MTTICVGLGKPIIKCSQLDNVKVGICYCLLARILAS